MKLACIVVFAVIALYVLSVGPVVRFAGLTTTVRSVYAPLEWIADETPFGAPLEWYFDLWIARPPKIST